ncbi:hypothetical protein [Neorhizobium sp. P12A]|uniref:hypothetical protein n=1 Tax=Neorhizobium sp. P12A TaxID=2268027 RepID=UPI00165D8D07|nr:hypothetical protein [Neorhizobium sp. P12A]
MIALCQYIRDCRTSIAPESFKDFVDRIDFGNFGTDSGHGYSFCGQAQFTTSHIAVD